MYDFVDYIHHCYSEEEYRKLRRINRDVLFRRLKDNKPTDTSFTFHFECKFKISIEGRIYYMDN